MLLFFAPRILIFPTVFISVFANGFLLVGLVNIKRGNRDKDIIEGEAEWVKTDDEPISGILEDKTDKTDKK